MKLIWLPGALTDLENIYGFYASQSENAAKKLCEDIFNYINMLPVFPELGKQESINQNSYKPHRCLILPKRNIKIIYYLENQLIYIAFIWDCRQNPENLKQKLKL